MAVGNTPVVVTSESALAILFTVVRLSFILPGRAYRKLHTKQHIIEVAV